MLGHMSPEDFTLLQPSGSKIMAGTLDTDLLTELRDRLSETAAKCSERCLYQSAKWYADPQVNR